MRITNRKRDVFLGIKLNSFEHQNNMNKSHGVSFHKLKKLQNPSFMVKLFLMDFFILIRLVCAVLVVSYQNDQIA